VKRRQIHLREVGSRAVAAIGYDDERHELYVLYRNERRGLYIYSDVSLSEWHMLERTSSVGAIVNAHIKTRHFFRRADPSEIEIIIQRESPAAPD
jgi:hypothetical protein